MGGVRGVGLVLVDERGGRVGRFLDVVGALVDGRGRTVTGDAVGSGRGGPGQDHEVGRAPGTNSGSSGLSGIITVPPPLVVRSRPWSKNCPKIVNSELNGAESPTSGATFGIDSVPEASGTAPAAAPRRRGWSPSGRRSGCSRPAGASRGRCPSSGCTTCRSRRRGSGPERCGGKTVSAAPSFDLPASRLLQVPSTVREPPRQLRTLLVAVGDLIRTCAEQRPARIRGSGAGGVGLRNLDLLEDESHVGEVQVEPLTDGGVRGRHGPRREEAGDNGERSGSGHWSLPAVTPPRPAGERLSQSIHVYHFRVRHEARWSTDPPATIRRATLNGVEKLSGRRARLGGRVDGGLGRPSIQGRWPGGRSNAGAGFPGRALDTGARAWSGGPQGFHRVACLWWATGSGSALVPQLRAPGPPRRERPGVRP